ncbi:DNA cytosine methyltransferase [Vibrio splendidus]
MMNDQNGLMTYLDLCSGIGAFPYALSQMPKGTVQLIGCSEVTDFCNRVLDKHGHELLGDVRELGGSPSDNPLIVDLMEQDSVPCEHMGRSSLTMEDMLSGHVPFPDVVVAGFPCPDISSSNSNPMGIHGKKASVIEDILDLVESTEPYYVLLENTQHLNGRGLFDILERARAMNYDAEWGLIACTNFGFPFYRHRCFVILKHHSSPACRYQHRLFPLMARYATRFPGERFPMFDDHDDATIKSAVTLATKTGNRRARIDGLGNTIVADIAYAWVETLYLCHNSDTVIAKPYPTTPLEVSDLPSHPTLGYTQLPRWGELTNGQYFESPPDRLLGPTSKAYPHITLMPTLLANDKKNNFTSGSRTRRPGGLGGLVGALQSTFQFTEGGLCAEYCEPLMGFPVGYTEV